MERVTRRRREVEGSLYIKTASSQSSWVKATYQSVPLLINSNISCHCSRNLSTPLKGQNRQNAAMLHCCNQCRLVDPALETAIILGLGSKTPPDGYRSSRPHAHLLLEPPRKGNTRHVHASPPHVRQPNSDRVSDNRIAEYGDSISQHALFTVC